MTTENGFRITVGVTGGNSWFMVYCPEMNVSGQGATIPEALQSMGECIVITSRHIAINKPEDKRYELAKAISNMIGPVKSGESITKVSHPSGCDCQQCINVDIL